MREHRTREKCIDCRGAEGMHAPGLKSLLRRVPVGKDDCRDKVVENCIAKIFEALVRESARNEKT